MLRPLFRTIFIKFSPLTKDRGEKGIALLMVIMAITLLSFLLADFTIESKINKLKIMNQQDKEQAKLNAEAGLKFALAKLKLYKSARNFIEKNESLKEAVSLGTLEGIIVQPFMYPIAAPPDADHMIRDAIEEFEKTNLMQGKLSLFMSPVRGFLNPNNLRVAPTSSGSGENAQSGNDDQDESTEKLPPHIFIERKLVEVLKHAIDSKKESDENFRILYDDLDPVLLIKELKYYVNDPKNFNDSEKNEIERLYSSNEIKAKHAPLTSISELYLLEGWNDTIVDMIKDQLTVHEVSIISINEITKFQLKTLFPTISEEQTEDFFKYRDGDQSPEATDDEKLPHPFKSEKDFMSTIVNRIRIVDEETYLDRIEEFKNAGIRLGTAGALFNIISRGEYGNTTFTLNAFIRLPVKPPPKKKKEKENNPEDKQETAGDDDNQDENREEEKTNEPEKEKQKKEPPVELLEPRIIEIYL